MSFTWRNSLRNNSIPIIPKSSLNLNASQIFISTLKSKSLISKINSLQNYLQVIVLKEGVLSELSFDISMELSKNTFILACHYFNLNEYEKSLDWLLKTRQTIEPENSFYWKNRNFWQSIRLQTYQKIIKINDKINKNNNNLNLISNFIEAFDWKIANSTLIIDKFILKLANLLFSKSKFSESIVILDKGIKSIRNLLRNEDLKLKIKEKIKDFELFLSNKNIFLARFLCIKAQIFEKLVNFEIASDLYNQSEFLIYSFAKKNEKSWKIAENIKEKKNKFDKIYNFPINISNRNSAKTFMFAFGTERLTKSKTFHTKNTSKIPINNELFRRKSKKSVSSHKISDFSLLLNNKIIRKKIKDRIKENNKYFNSKSNKLFKEFDLNESSPEKIRKNQIFQLISNRPVSKLPFRLKETENIEEIDKSNAIKRFSWDLKLIIPSENSINIDESGLLKTKKTISTSLKSPNKIILKSEKSLKTPLLNEFEEHKTDFQQLKVF